MPLPIPDWIRAWPVAVVGLDYGLLLSALGTNEW